MLFVPYDISFYTVLMINVSFYLIISEVCFIKAVLTLGVS